MATQIKLAKIFGVYTMIQKNLYYFLVRGHISLGPSVGRARQLSGHQTKFIVKLTINLLYGHFLAKFSLVPPTTAKP